MITKWLHLDYRGGDRWILPIISAANAAVARGAVSAIPLELSDLSLFVSTRLDMLPRIVSRINRGVVELYAAIRESYTPRHVFTPEQAGAVVRVDDRITYD